MNSLLLRRSRAFWLICQSPQAACHVTKPASPFLRLIFRHHFLEQQQQGRNFWECNAHSHSPSHQKRGWPNMKAGTIKRPSKKKTILMKLQRSKPGVWQFSPEKCFLLLVGDDAEASRREGWTFFPRNVWVEFLIQNLCKWAVQNGKRWYVLGVFYVHLLVYVCGIMFRQHKQARKEGLKLRGPVYQYGSCFIWCVLI